MREMECFLIKLYNENYRRELITLAGTKVHDGTYNENHLDHLKQ